MDIFNAVQQFVGHDNEFFKGGLLLAFLGFVGAYLRGLPRTVAAYVGSRLVYTLRIDSDEDALYKALGALLDSPDVRVTTRSFRLVFEENYRDRGRRAQESVRRHYNADFFAFVYRGFTYYVDFEEVRSHSGHSQFIYKISCYWRARAAIENLMAAVSQRVSNRAEDELELYARESHHFRYSLARKRPFDSLYYEPELIEGLLADIDSFMRSRDWYRRLGIPYRRGYLLYGEPGTGKTSLIKGVASYLDKPLYILGEAAVSGAGGGLGAAFRDVPEGSIVVIEDFDRLFVQDKGKKQPKAEQLSMRDLLNQMDGLESKEGIMVFLTANHRAVFDAALERPGRIDRKFYISYMGWAGARKMFLNFYGEAHLAEFERVWLDGLFTPAQLQVYFSKYKHDPRLAVERFGAILEEIGENNLSEPVA